MKKRWMALALLLCLLWNTGTWAEQAATPTLQYSWWGSAEIDAATQDAIDRFIKARRSSVAVEPRRFETKDAYTDWLAEQWSAGTPGDVVELDTEMLRTLARNANGVPRLLDLEAYPKELDLTQFTYFGLLGCLIDNRLYAVPMSVSSHVFFWNTTALAQRESKVPQNEEELFALAKTFRADGGAYPLAASAESRIALLITYLQSKHGQPWLDEKTGDVTFTVAQVAEGLNYLNRFEAEGVWPSLADQGDPQAGWQQGRYLGIWAWDSQSAELSAALPEASKMETTAQLADWSPYGGGFHKVVRMLAIPANAKSPELAATFIEYLLNAENGARALMDLRGTPDSTNAAAVCSKKRLLNPVQTAAKQTARSWARYMMPSGFDAPGLAGMGGIYEQVLLGYGAGLMTDEAAAYALISGIKAGLQ
jgi:oligogalacturonide transport system substrate-binding protein